MVNTSQYSKLAGRPYTTYKQVVQGVNIGHLTAIVMPTPEAARRVGIGLGRTFQDDIFGPLENLTETGKDRVLFVGDIPADSRALDQE